LKQLPITKFCILFIIGILFGYYFQFSSNFFILYFIVSVLISLLCQLLIKPHYQLKNLLTELTVLLSIFLCGISVLIVKTDKFDNNYFGKYIVSEELTTKRSIVEIISPLSESGKFVKLNVKVIGLANQDKYQQTSGKALVFLNKDSSSIKLLPGDKLQLLASFTKVEQPKNPQEFNYSNYLKNQQIEFVCYAYDSWNFDSEVTTIRRLATICRNYCLRVFKNSGLESSELALATALTFGYKEKLQIETKKSFSNTGVMHILAVSGLHVGILYTVLAFLFNCFQLAKKLNWIKPVLILFIIWSFAFITGLSSSVLRAVIMLTFFVIADSIYKNVNVYNILSTSAILILLYDPLVITHVSFQLSYLAVIGILYLYPKIEKKLIFKNKILKYFWQLLAVSVAAQIATFPIGLYYFHQFPSYFLLTNIFIIPLAFILFCLGLMIIAFSFSNLVTIFIAKVVSLVVKLMTFVISSIEEFPLSVISGVSISLLEVVLIYSSILLFLGFIYLRNRIIFTLCVFSVLLLFYLDYKEDQTYLKQKKIIAYSLKNEFALDLINGKNHYFISTIKEKNSRLIDFKIRNNWIHLDLNQPIFISLDSLISKTISWQGKKLAFINDMEKEIENFDIGFLLTNNLSNKQSLERFNGKTIILQSNFRNHQILKENKAAFFDLSSSGAYIHNL